MTSFLFTAVNRDGKSVTERVESENLSQARYRLETQGYSEITFYESELSNETSNLFGEKARAAQKKFLKNQVEVQYDTRIRSHFLRTLKITSIPLALLAYFVYISPDLTGFLWLGGTILVLSYLSVPVIAFNKLYKAHIWARNSQVRFWVGFAKLFNKITLNKIPLSELDVYLSCADAREGKMDSALSRIMKYQNEPKVSKRMFNTILVRIYMSAKDFDAVLKVLENSLHEGNIYTEELIDYAVCLVRRHKRTDQARETLQKVFDRELTAIANLFIPYCQGIIEVEDENFPQAEFYLKQAAKQLDPFKNNEYLTGLRSEINAFLAIVLGKLGERDKAERLLKEAKPYLIAQREKELLLKCEELAG